MSAEILWNGQRGTLVVDDHSVPYVECLRSDDLSRDGEIELVLDGRFGITTDMEELQSWGSILANAMAVCAGWSCHGENCVPLNRHKRKVHKITSAE